MNRYLIFLFITLYFPVRCQFIQDTIRFIALGDSYTIGQSVDKSDTWPNQFIDSLFGLGFYIERNDVLATTGWTTGKLLQALNDSDLKQDYNLVSILIGVNNFYQNQPVGTFRLELSNIIDAALTLTNQDTGALFLITIPDYGYTPFGESQKEVISANTNLYNQIKDSTAKEYGIPLVDITPISRNGIIDPDLVAKDGLHPSEKQYRLWVNMVIEELINDFAIETEEVKNKMDYTFVQNGKKFKLSSTNEGFCEIYDLSGRTIKRFDLNKIFNLSSGVFLFRITIGSQTYFHKVIVRN